MVLQLGNQRRDLIVHVTVDLIAPLAAGTWTYLDVGRRQVTVEGDGEEQRQACKRLSQALLNQAWCWLGPPLSDARGKRFHFHRTAAGPTTAGEAGAVQPKQ
ncbi:MAG TPA: hypothetical protein VEQ87_23630 [Burkholderiales bacterium]|nr:hypothetical protein [Burkholderiales bacterium]